MMIFMHVNYKYKLDTCIWFSLKIRIFWVHFFILLAPATQVIMCLELNLGTTKNCSQTHVCYMLWHHHHLSLSSWKLFLSPCVWRRTKVCTFIPQPALNCYSELHTHTHLLHGDIEWDTEKGRELKKKCCGDSDDAMVVLVKAE